MPGPQPAPPFPSSPQTTTILFVPLSFVAANYTIGNRNAGLRPPCPWYFELGGFLSSFNLLVLALVWVFSLNVTKTSSAQPKLLHIALSRPIVISL